MALSLAAALLVGGCGTPGAPLPPSLKLPDPVTDLTALRTGNQVALAWTMPRRNTDKLLITGDIAVRVCRGQSAGKCVAVPGDRAFAPQAHATFTDTLPSELAAGAARSLTYFVELRNSKGRSAGLSNEAAVLAGEAPAPVAGLAAEVRKQGIVLRWTPDAADTEPSARTVIRLHRTLLTPPSKPAPEAGSAVAREAASAGKPSAQPGAQPGILAPPAEPVEQSLLVGDILHPGRTPDRVLDKSIRFGQTYEYRAQRVARVPICGSAPTDSRESTNCKIFELPGPLSDPIRVEAIDVFPPEVPTGLAAVATAADSSSGSSPSPFIDLSWQPVTDTDLAGYAVYRREGDAGWQRISPPQPVVGPGFHDPEVQAGHSYRYAVTAIDHLGHESARSAETEETVPNQ
jgi:hypothetical protein